MNSNENLYTAIRLCIDSINSVQVLKNYNNKYVINVLRELANQPYQGRHLGKEKYNVFERKDWLTYQQRINTYHNISAIDSDYLYDGSLGDNTSYWVKAIILLMDNANFTNDEIFEVAKKVKDNHLAYFLILDHIVFLCLEEEDVDLALDFISKYDDDIMYMGYYYLVEYFAYKADYKNFAKYYNLSRDRDGLHNNDLKTRLVKEYCKKHGIDNALALCKKKHIGKSFQFDALDVLAKRGEYSTIKNILDNNAELLKAKPHHRLLLLVDSFSEAIKNNTSVDDDFESLYTKSVNLEKKHRFDNMRLRDYLLLIMGMAYQDIDKERALKCRKAIRYNAIKFKIEV